MPSRTPHTGLWIAHCLPLLRQHLFSFLRLLPAGTLASIPDVRRCAQHSLRRAVVLVLLRVITLQRGTRLCLTPLSLRRISAAGALRTARSA